LRKFLSESPEATIEFAAKFAKALKPGDIVALVGNLGAGKTTFTKGIAKGLGVKDYRHVNSPTFVLIKEYKGKTPLYHFDLYRLNNIKDIEDIDSDGYFWVQGRDSDVLKVSGHRIGNSEIESALVSHPLVAEAAAIGKPHEIKGESITAFVILKKGTEISENLRKELIEHVGKEIGKLARPDEILFVEDLPKTRSGKIMRRVIKAKVLGQDTGNISTLSNPEAVEELLKAK